MVQKRAQIGVRDVVAISLHCQCGISRQYSLNVEYIDLPSRYDSCGKSYVKVADGQPYVPEDFFIHRLLEVRQIEHDRPLKLTLDFGIED